MLAICASAPCANCVTSSGARAMKAYRWSCFARHISRCAPASTMSSSTPLGAGRRLGVAVPAIDLSPRRARTGSTIHLLQQMRKDADKFRPAIELMYLCVSLGFTGHPGASQVDARMVDRLREESTPSSPLATRPSSAPCPATGRVFRYRIGRRAAACRCGFSRRLYWRHAAVSSMGIDRVERRVGQHTSPGAGCIARPYATGDQDHRGATAAPSPGAAGANNRRSAERRAETRYRQGSCQCSRNRRRADRAHREPRHVPGRTVQRFNQRPFRCWSGLPRAEGAGGNT